VPGDACHPSGRDDYRMRTRTVGPVFGQLKTCQKLATMSRRGLTARETNGCSPSERLEGYAKLSLKKYRPIAARNEDRKVFNGLL
jgi:hypothetical protein